ncbi:MAG TPA: hypothetical protein VN426_07840 [Syntrophomonadaceae bacterium]|nr:hypothetical protein [Syntrophomonadaceae bacterium]
MKQGYDYIIKNLPLTPCPQGLSDRVLRECGFVEKATPNRPHWNSPRPRIRYGLVSLLTALLILTGVGYDLSIPRFVPCERIGINTVSLVTQLSQNLKMLISLNERGAGK